MHEVPGIAILALSADHCAAGKLLRKGNPISQSVSRIKAKKTDDWQKQWSDRTEISSSASAISVAHTRSKELHQQQQRSTPTCQNNNRSDGDNDDGR